VGAWKMGKMENMPQPHDTQTQLEKSQRAKITNNCQMSDKRDKEKDKTCPQPPAINAKNSAKTAFCGPGLMGSQPKPNQMPIKLHTERGGYQISATRRSLISVV